MNDRPALLIANPHSRHGEAKQRQALEALQRHGIAVAHADWQPENLTRIIAGKAADVRAVIVAGGDGTLNAAAQGLIDTGLPLGILPMGTANDLARTLAIPTDLDAAAQIIAEVRLRRIDIGMANGLPFFNVASIGFGVDLTRALTRDSKRRWGTLGYATAALRTLRRMRPFTAHIIQGDDVHISRTVHLAVGN
jgi:diacylglycerol kinase (ATP)